MSSPRPEQFAEFFRAIYEKDPFPWQVRLAKRVVDGDWPRAIALPTAAGKTACIDIAIFALACRAKAASRRIFFVVDRRIVVDQAFEHTKKLAERLKKPATDIEQLVAESLRELTGEADARPLDVYALRGGMYRESAWARSPLQPTVIASTVDQVGSRLLFRGYGVSDSMKPVHAGLVGNDALILLDEAHCAKPFYQTMQAIESYRKWGNENKAPFRFVSITATPTGEVPKQQIERDEEDDRNHAVLGKRIKATKPATLVVADKAKGKNGTTELVKKLETHSKELAIPDGCVGIIVNRVKTARELAKKLGDEAVLLTGRMRPLDRDRLVRDRLQPLFSDYKGEQKPPKFVVGTQCLECGADFDFHALVTECASLDALRQRFGRLNRVAARPGAKAVIIVRGDQTEPEDKEEDADPVYGNALANTWKWLRGDSEKPREEFDFGVSAVREQLEGMSAEELEKLNAPAVDAPVLFPAHLDCWVQTHPIPTLDPDPALFLHGPKQPGQPDVQVVFRSDLGEEPNQWADIVALCPPSSSEAVPVRIGDFKRWLTGEPITDSSDVEGEADNGSEETVIRTSLRWRGPEKSGLVTEAGEVSAEDVYVVPCNAPESASLGDFPFGLSDYAEESFQRSRDKAVLRLPQLVIDDEHEDFEARLTEAIRTKTHDDFPTWSPAIVDHLTDKRKRECDKYPEPRKGFVVIGRGRLQQFDPTYLDDSEPAESFRGKEVSLEAHSRGVAHHAKRFATGCGLPANLYEQVGFWHDLGKLDPRFQAMLKQSSPRTAVGVPLAKSARTPRSKQEQDAAREVHKYPRGARHELLSAALVGEKTDDDLTLYLIATHHGSARPFANLVDDAPAPTDMTPFERELFGASFGCVSFRQMIQEWNAELPERFWRVIRKFGWWGAAYHEAVFRLADHTQSRAEQETKCESFPETPPTCALPAVVGRAKYYPLPLTGLDGSNPLAFLAALGTLVACDRLLRSSDRPDWLVGPITLSWGLENSRYTPVLNLSAWSSPSGFVDFMAEHLARSPDKHPMAIAFSILERDEQERRPLIRDLRLPGSSIGRASQDWITALLCETNPALASRLQTVRRDYLIGNLRSVMQQTTDDHLRRCLFEPWDYADSLNNQSLHWEPGEDRRHAYQWLVPTNSRSRETGGMLGANRLALEAWPLFPSFQDGYSDSVRTRGFRGTRADDTFWTWPLWSSCLTPDGVASILSLPALQSPPAFASLRKYGVTAAFQCQRILVGKTPNLTPSVAIG